MQSIRVLLVDDHKIVIDGLKMMLADAKGIEITGEAGNGEEAIKLIHETENKPELIIMDLQMPVCDGLEATMRIKKKFPEIKVLILTMSNHGEQIEKLVNSGANGYLLKSSGKEEFLDAIDKLRKNEKFLSPVALDSLISHMRDKDKNPVNTEVQLTEREIDVLKKVAEGKTSQEIGKELFISHHTVETHRRNLMSKMGVSRSAELISKANGMGFLD